MFVLGGFLLFDLCLDYAWGPVAGEDVSSSFMLSSALGPCLASDGIMGLRGGKGTSEIFTPGYQHARDTKGDSRAVLCSYWEVFCCSVYVWIIRLVRWLGGAFRRINTFVADMRVFPQV